MPDYQVLARKYRPQFFRDVVGQDVIVTTIRGAIKMERTAHAYLFCGSKGTGKTSLARLFAKALNCEELSPEGEPCNLCSSCKETASGNALDVLEIDGASHRGIEDVRQIIETIGYVPTRGKYKIYLIDEVHMLTKEAFNALLKTLEEPPPKVKFFFATTEPQKIPPTILSRCQRFNLRRIAQAEIVQKLTSIAQEIKIDITPEVLSLIAELAEGSLRDAESLLDQLIAFHDNKITFESASEILGKMPRKIFFALDEAGAKQDLSVAFSIAEEIYGSGRNIVHFVDELTLHFRTLLAAKIGALKPAAAYIESAKCYTKLQCLEILEILIEAQNQIKFAPSQRIALEMLLLRIIRTHGKIQLDTIVEKLCALEQKLGSQKSLPSAPKAEAPSKSGEAHKSKTDNLMQFAAKELGGSLSHG